MIPKPSTADGYGSEPLRYVRGACLYVATKLGDLLPDIVVVGGLVPYLLVDQDNLPAGSEPHAGTLDLDMGLALALLDRERYRELGARLRDAGFEPDINEQGNERRQTWTAPPRYPVTVDFLIAPADDADEGGAIRHIESDLAAIVTPGLELAFEDRREIEISGETLYGGTGTRRIPVCGPGAFTVLKALAFGNRAANKDAYDLFYVWKGVGVRDVAGSLRRLQPNPHVDQALSIIEADFCRHDGLGPVGTAHFIAGGPDDDIQADVVGYSQDLLRLMEPL